MTSYFCVLCCNGLRGFAKGTLKMNIAIPTRTKKAYLEGHIEAVHSKPFAFVALNSTNVSLSGCKRRFLASARSTFPLLIQTAIFVVVVATVATVAHYSRRIRVIFIQKRLSWQRSWRKTIEAKEWITIFSPPLPSVKFIIEILGTILLVTWEQYSKTLGNNNFTEVLLILLSTDFVKNKASEKGHEKDEKDIRKKIGPHKT